MNCNERSKTQIMVRIAMLSALAAVLEVLSFPIPFIAPGFYKIDFSEVGVLIGAFAYGPVAGIVAEFIKNLIKIIIEGSNTGFVGEISNFVTGCAFVVPASVIYKYRRNLKSALLGMSLGVLAMVLVSFFSNLYVMIPLYSKMMPLDTIIGMASKIHSSIDSTLDMILLCVIPFNIIKGILASFVTFLLYKKVRRLL